MSGWCGPSFEGEFPSLGWQIADHIQASLKVPAGPLYGQDLVLTGDQLDFFVRLYALTSEGRRVFRRASRVGPKGRGKSPEGAIFCFEEFCGPVQFDGWDANGNPVGKQRDYPWVQVAACSEEQDHNLYGPLREMIAESPALDDEGIDLGKTRVEFKGRPGKIEPVSASAGAREGQPITAVALEESGLWFPSKGGDKLAAALRRNCGKTAGTSVEFTNPPALGEGSVAEATLAAATKGEKGLLYSAAEAPFVEDHKNPANRQKVLDALAAGYDDGDGNVVPWIDLERVYNELIDSDTTVEDGLRFYFGLARKANNRAFNPTRFDDLAEPPETTREWAEPGYELARITPSPVADDVPVLLMFDGARTRDSAVLSAWTLAERPYHFHVASWTRPARADAEYEHPRGEIKAAVRDFLGAHDCAAFAYDSSFRELQSMYDDWTDEHGELDPKHGTGLMVDYPTASGQRMQAAIDRTLEDTRAGSYRHDGDPLITEHVHNAVLAKNRGGWRTLDKERDSMKIDGAVTFTFGYDLIPFARIALENRAESATVMFAFT